MRHIFLIRDLDPPRGPSSDEVIEMLKASGWTIAPEMEVGFCRSWLGVGNDAVLVFADKEPGESEQKLSWSAYELILGDHRMESAMLSADPRYPTGQAPDATTCRWVLRADRRDILVTLDRLIGIGFKISQNVPLMGLHKTPDLVRIYGRFKNDQAALEAVPGVLNAKLCREETN